MRKYIVYIALLLISLAACQEDSIPGYAIDRDGLQFNYDTNEMQLDYKFIDRYRVDTVWQWGYPYPYRHYFGDSLLRDTLSLYVTLMGHSGVEDREFKLKTVLLDGQDPATTAKVEFFPSYRFRAGQLTDTIQFVVLLPETRGNYMVGLTFDLDESDPYFETGAAEKKIYKLRVSNRYPKPEYWDTQKDYLGEYSEEKYAFMVSILHSLFDMYDNWAANNVTLREELQKYNDEHPGNPKDFTFPVWTKPSWWDYPYIQPYVGEYSEAKKDFIVSIVGQYNFDNATWAIDWASTHTQLREEYDAWNEAHPDDQLMFPQFPENPVLPDNDK